MSRPKRPSAPVFRFEDLVPTEEPEGLLDRLAELFVRVAIERRT